MFEWVDSSQSLRYMVEENLLFLNLMVVERLNLQAQANLSGRGARPASRLCHVVWLGGAACSMPSNQTI